MRIIRGNNENQARLWYLLYEVLTKTPTAQPIVSSYPLPISMLSPGGINCNIVTDSIHTAKKIFDPSLHPYQLSTSAILFELHTFFSHHQENLIKFWECSSHSN